MGMEINYSQERTGGAYWERMHQKNRKEYQMPPNTEEEIKAAEKVKKEMEGVEVSMSPEAEEFLAGTKARKEAAQAEYDRLEKESYFSNMENPFEFSGGGRPQYSIFSKALSEQGFYDNMSDEEVLEAEDLLISITYGMNSIRGGSQEGVNSQFSQLSSHAARFELESSTAALRQFSNKYLPESMKASFNTLIEKYYEHNDKQLEGYRSSEEIVNELKGKLLERTASQRISPVSAEEKVSQMASKVEIRKEDEEAAVNGWKKCFQSIMNGKSTVEDAISQMKNILKSYVSGNSENENFLKYVEQWNEFSIKNANSYWSKVI